MINDYTKIAESIRNINDFVKDQIQKGVPDGLFCTPLKEPRPSYNQALCEKTITGQNSSFIVLGRDRNSTLISGAGGKGLPMCGMIDLVAGRMSSYQNKNSELLTKDDIVEPNFAADAARVYITQKSMNIDEYFSIPESRKGCTSKMKSAVALKADQVRVISREKMVFFCGKGTFEGFNPEEGELNSLRRKISKPPRIEFLTGDPEKLEPVVLGNKLMEFLKKQNGNSGSMANAMLNVQTQLATINSVLTVLCAGAPPFSKFAVDNLIGMSDSITESLNQVLSEIKFLDSLVVKGEGSILSDTVFTS